MRTTQIEKTQTPKTAKWLVKNKDKLRFDLAIQRNKVWKADQKSLWIHTLIYGYPFPPCYAHYSTDGYYWMLDGKQRLTTTIDFIEGKFALDASTPDVWGEKIAGKTFEELPEEMKEAILDTNFIIYELKNMTNEEVHEMFLRLNNGTPLNKMELNRAIADPKVMEVINEISKKKFFKEMIGVSDSARNRFADQEIIFQTIMLLKDVNKGFSSKDIREFIEGLTIEHLDDTFMKRFNNIIDYLEQAFEGYTIKERKQALKKVHVPIIVITAEKAIDNKLKPEQFGKFIKHFLIDNYDVNSYYGQACQSGSAKRDNVVIRITEMRHGLEEFMEKLQ